MKLLLKNKGRVSMISRAVLVIGHISLWIFLMPIVCFSEEKPIAFINSVKGKVDIEHNEHRLPAKKGDYLFKDDCIIMACPSEIHLSHQLKDQPQQIQVIEEKNGKCKYELNISPGRHGGGNANLLYIHLQEKFDYDFIPYPSLSEEKKSGSPKSFLKEALLTIIRAPFPDAPQYSDPAAGREKYFHQAKIADLLSPPVGTKVMARKPDFTWLSLEGVKKYEFILFDGLGDVVWKKIIERERKEEEKELKVNYAYSKEETAPALNSGEYYFWQVNGVDGREQESERWKNLYVTSGIAYFTIMPEQEVEEMNKTIRETQQQLIETTPHETFTLYLGAYYEENQLYGKALTAYENLLESQPENDLYRKMLANLYVKIGREWAAVRLIEK